MPSHSLIAGSQTCESLISESPIARSRNAESLPSESLTDWVTWAPTSCPTTCPCRTATPAFPHSPHPASGQKIMERKRSNTVKREVVKRGQKRRGQNRGHRKVVNRGQKKSGQPWSKEKWSTAVKRKVVNRGRPRTKPARTRCSHGPRQALLSESPLSLSLSPSV